MSPHELFDEVVRRSRLGRLVAPFTIRRLLVRANVVSPEAVTPEELAQALPSLEEGLRLYLPAGEVEAAMHSIRELAAAE